MTKLSVNLNKVALMRNARGGGRPNVLRAAIACVSAGTDGITLHPRPDGRHALAQDVIDLKEWLPVELNVEGNPFEGPSKTDGYAFPGFMEILRQTRPTQATLVPDATNQKTSDHGWTLDNNEVQRLMPFVAELQELGCRVSLFMDPDPNAIKRAADLGVDRIELYTEMYARAFESGEAEQELSRYADAARVAQVLGLGVNAGHDLSLENLQTFLEAVPNVLEVSIGQALISDALHMGLAAAVKAYQSVLKNSALVSNGE